MELTFYPVLGFVLWTDIMCIIVRRRERYHRASHTEYVPNIMRGIYEKWMPLNSTKLRHHTYIHVYIHIYIFVCEYHKKLLLCIQALSAMYTYTQLPVLYDT